MLVDKKWPNNLLRKAWRVFPVGLVIGLWLGLLSCRDYGHRGFEQEVSDALHRAIQHIENAGENSNMVFADGMISERQLAFAIAMHAAHAELQMLTRKDVSANQNNCALVDGTEQVIDGCRLIQAAYQQLAIMRLHGENVFQQLSWGKIRQASRAMALSAAAARAARRDLNQALKFYVDHMQTDIIRSAESFLRLAMLSILALLLFLIFGLHWIMQNRRHQQQLMERDKSSHEYIRKLELIGREVRRLRDLGSAIDATAGVLIFNQQHKAVSVNEGFRQLRGLKNTSVQGQNIVSILGLEDTDLVDDIIAAVSTKEIWRGEICGRGEDGSGIWMYVLFYPELDDFEDFDGSLALVLDITESKKSQLIFDRTRHLTALGEMAGGIAHEINNPLSVINGRVSVLLKKLHAQSLDSELLQSGLEQIQRTVTRIARIVDSMRRLSRSDAQAEVPRPEKLDAVLRETLEFTEDKLRKFNVQLSIHDELVMSEAFVMVHGFGVSQILINLISNAVDAIESTGATERWIRVELGRSSQSTLAIKVVDPGRGIPKPLREKIMEPFFTTKPAGKGTGLGLSLSQRIAEEHGGRLIYDEDAAQTTFILELPELQKARDVA